jgi:hypothetical protein
MHPPTREATAWKRRAATYNYPALWAKAVKKLQALQLKDA